jgi:nucleoid DNA-binding protein
MGNLTKRDLVIRISNETGIVQSEVFDVVQKTLDYITDSLSEGHDVELRNFGVFEVRLTKPRVGRNPNEPGSRYEIPERATVKFKMGKVMRQRVSRVTATLKETGESA